MKTITGISTYRGLVSISVGGGFAAKIKQKHFNMRPLVEGDCVDFDAWLDAVSALQAAEAYEAALTCLDRAARTSSGLLKTLLEKGYARPCAQSAIQRLEANHLLDDARFARRMAETHAQRPIGAYAVKRKMMQKGISQEDAEEAMESFDDAQQAQAALKAAQSLSRKYCDLPRREARGKLSQALARRGFSWDAISEAVEKTLGEDWD